MFFDEEMQVKRNRCDEVVLERYSVKKRKAQMAEERMDEVNMHFRKRQEHRVTKGREDWESTAEVVIC